MEQEQITDLGLWTNFGLVFIILGFFMYVSTILSFMLRGKGTPAIWFSKFLKFIIGEEPIHLVSSGLYKYSRNPMYLGILLIVFGQGMYFEILTILEYGIFMSILLHLVVLFIEEPHLKKKYGNSYLEYKKSTPRWFSIN